MIKSSLNTPRANIKTVSLLMTGLTVLGLGLLGGQASAASLTGAFNPMPAGQNNLLTPSMGLGAQVTSSQATTPTWSTSAPQPGDPGDSSFVLGVNVFSTSYSFSLEKLCPTDTINSISILLPNFNGVSGGGEDAVYYDLSVDGGTSLYSGNKDLYSTNFGGPFTFGSGYFAPSSFDLDNYTISVSPGLSASSIGSIIVYEFRDMSSAYLDGLTKMNLDTPTITIDYTEDTACSTDPIATDPDIATTAYQTPITLNILNNDSGSGLTVFEVDGQDIVAGQTITLGNGSGTVTLNTDGTITFMPATGFSGESIFSYSITDGTQKVDTGVVIITVLASTTTSTTETQPTSTPTAAVATTSKLANTGQSHVILLAALSTMVLSAAVFTIILIPRSQRSN